MVLELRDYSSSDIERVWTWSPKHSSEVFFELTIDIGEHGHAGGNLFSLLVATPEGLRRVADTYSNYYFPDRAVLIFSTYSWNALMERINRILGQCSRNSWQESLLCLRQFFKWEYEDLKFEDEGRSVEK
jgi:hypothetical protein